MQAIGVGTDPGGEPRPCGGPEGLAIAKIYQIDPASDPGGRSVRCEFFSLTRQRMRILVVLCEKSAAIRGRAPMAALYSK